MENGITEIIQFKRQNVLIRKFNLTKNYVGDRAIMLLTSINVTKMGLIKNYFSQFETCRNEYNALVENNIISFENNKELLEIFNGKFFFQQTYSDWSGQ